MSKLLLLNHIRDSLLVSGSQGEDFKIDPSIIKKVKDEKKREQS
jgi:hypothetical protein